MKLLFLLLISYVIFPVYLPNILGAEQGNAELGVLYNCCLVCQHDPCLCYMPLDEMVASEIPSTDAQQPIQGKRYQCAYTGCAYATAYSSHLTNHERIHTGERPYKCPYPGCEYAAAQSSCLKIHGRIHTGEKPYTCTWDGCGRAFAQLGHLTGHMCTHTGEKPYKCNSCGGKYRHFFQLRAHSKRIHGIEIPPKKGGRPPKRTQENLDNDKAKAPEDQEAKRVHRGDL